MPKAKAKNGDQVVLNYVGTLDTGEEFDNTASRNQPMSVIVGDGGLIPAFSDALIGMSAGDTKTLHLEAAKGYGEYNPDAIVELPKETFPQEIQENLQVGMVLPLVMKENPKTPFPAKATEIKESSFMFDLNHPLAGKNINFDIEVLAVTKAKGKTSKSTTTTTIEETTSSED